MSPARPAEAQQLELFARWCESVRCFSWTCVRDDVLLRNAAEFVDAPKVHGERQKRRRTCDRGSQLESARRAG